MKKHFALALSTIMLLSLLLGCENREETAAELPNESFSSSEEESIAPQEQQSSQETSQEISYEENNKNKENKPVEIVPDFPDEIIPYDPNDSKAMIIEIEKLPTSLKEFYGMPQADLRRPQNTAAMFLCALNVYENSKDEGIAAINYLRGPRPMNEFEEQFIRDRLKEREYLITAYFDGAEPSNNYLPETPYILTLSPDKRPQDMEEGYLRLFMTTKGADSPRPVTFRQKDNCWYLWEYSSILTGIRTPAKDDPWA